MSAPDLPIRTERLVLRPAEPDDLDAVHSYWSDPEVTRYLPFPTADRAATFQRLARYAAATAPKASGEALFLLVELDSAVVGDVMLRLKAGDAPAVAELGWVLHPAYAGRGIAFEAASAMAALGFGHYGCHRLEAHLDPRNVRSAALCRRIGMRQEAHLRRDYQFSDSGEWGDTAIFGVLAEEWSAGQAVRPGPALPRPRP